MYLKYLNNIHNVSNYYSIVTNATHTEQLNLIREDGDSISLIFENKEITVFVLLTIWEELEKGTSTYDLDKSIEIFKNSKKYNI